jgi:hypothetical protein
MSIHTSGLPMPGREACRSKLVRRAGELSVADESQRINAPIQQGLADGSPDVDAVWRLLFDREVAFRARRADCACAG